MIYGAEPQIAAGKVADFLGILLYHGPLSNY